MPNNKSSQPSQTAPVETEAQRIASEWRAKNPDIRQAASAQAPSATSAQPAATPSADPDPTYVAGVPMTRTTASRGKKR